MPYVPPHRRNQEQQQQKEIIQQKVRQLNNGKMVMVGLDQWVCIRQNGFTKLCTSGIVGCVALVLTSPNYIGVAHVYDGFEDDWSNYKNQLNLPFGVMGGVTQATIAVSRKFGKNILRANLIKNWLISRSVYDIETWECSGFYICKNIEGNWGMFKKSIHNTDKFRHSDNLVASRSGPYIYRWGKLSQHAADSGS
ncbi:hypothetical protein [Microbulbifer epialgicus]|uniref:Uncharacterized protein n=1 Tax=Microbulbifer epialgicus TaxID=393907 RepID=A0ABV4P7J8_9GAMM